MVSPQLSCVSRRRLLPSATSGVKIPAVLAADQNRGTTLLLSYCMVTSRPAARSFRRRAPDADLHPWNHSITLAAACELFHRLRTHTSDEASSVSAGASVKSKSTGDRSTVGQGRFSVLACKHGKQRKNFNVRAVLGKVEIDSTVPRNIIAARCHRRGHPMKPHHARRICRSRNPFSPSIALWQHFVLPCHTSRQQRLLSCAAEAIPTSTPHAEAETPPPSVLAAIDALGIERNQQHEERGQVVRKVIDSKGENQFDSPRQATIWKYGNARAEQSIAATAELLLKAKKAYDESEDYKGVVVEAMAASRALKENSLPWCVRYAPGEEKRAEDRLALEIAKFHDYAKPSRTEALARRKVIEQVRTDAREVLPNHVLEVFGSERTGIALATSDIDLRLMPLEDLVDGSAKMPPSQQERKILLNCLHKLHRQKFLGSQEYLLPMMRHARYPLISLQHRSSGLDVQIVLSNDTSVSRELMQQYMQEHPYLRQVYSVVKTMFDVRGLSDVFRGGFGSYSIFMMLVASLRHMPNERNDATGALLNFLRFWGHFDTTKEGVSIEPPIIFAKSEELVMGEKTKSQILAKERKPLPAYMLCLRDPADPTNDLGRKGICIKHVQVTLQNLGKKLSKELSANTRHSFLKPLVGDIFLLNKLRRQKLDAEGRMIMRTMQNSIAHTAKAIRDEENAAAQQSLAVD